MKKKIAVSEISLEVGQLYSQKSCVTFSRHVMLKSGKIGARTKYGHYFIRYDSPSFNRAIRAMIALGKKGATK